MTWFEKDHFGRLRGPSDRVASLFDWTTPNLITLTGCLLVLPMAWAFLAGHVVLGLVLFLVGIFTDLLDGPLARYQEAAMSADDRWDQGFHPFLLRRGQTSEGSAFDPFVDKLRFFGAALPMGWYSLWRAPMLAALACAILVTIARIFVRAGANKLGKYKAVVEFVLVVILVAGALGVPHLIIPANATLVAAALGGVFSLATQVYSWTKRKNASV